MIALIITSMVLFLGDSSAPTKEFSIDISGDEQVLERTIELPPLNCGSETKVEVRILNKLTSNFKADQISTSCGCISKLTDTLELRKNQTGPITFVIAMPKGEETFTRFVTLSDLTLGRSLRIAVKCKAISSIRLAKDRLNIEKEEIAKFSIPIQANSELDLRKLRVSISGSEATKGVIVVDSKGTGSFEIEIDPKLTIDNALHSSVVIEFVQDQKFIARSDLFVCYPFRTGLSPSTLAFTKSGETWKGKLIVHSHRLHESLKSDKQLNATLRIENAKEKTNVSCTVRRTESPACFVEITLPLESMERSAGKRVAIRLESGDWHVDVPVQPIQ